MDWINVSPGIDTCIIDTFTVTRISAKNIPTGPDCKGKMQYEVCYSYTAVKKAKPFDIIHRSADLDNLKKRIASSLQMQLPL